MPPHDRQVRRCDECGSSFFFLDTSPMAGLCSECSHYLYGYNSCEHVFEDGSCSRCGWDGSRSEYVAGIVAGGAATKSACPELALIVLRCPDIERSKLFFEALGLRWTREKHGSGPSHWSCSFGKIVLELYPGADVQECTQRLGFRVRSIDAILPSVLDAGGVVLENDRKRGFALVRAPNGTKVELTQSQVAEAG